MHTITDIQAEFARLDKITGLDTSKIPIEITDRRVSKYGTVRFHDRKPVKVIFAEHILREEEAFWNTVRHEYAHILARARNPRRRIEAHGEEWKAACKITGCIPKSRSPSTESAKRLRRERAKYIVRCADCGDELLYLKKGDVVKSLLRGETTYYCGKCDGRLELIGKP